MLQRLVAVVIALSTCLAVAAVPVRAQYRDDYNRGRREHREHERWERGYGYDRRYPLPGYHVPPGVGLFLPFR